MYVMFVVEDTSIKVGIQKYSCVLLIICSDTFYFEEKDEKELWYYSQLVLFSYLFDICF